MPDSVISMDEYLNTSYSPDREYIDGVVVERNTGERPHSLVLRNILLYLRTAHPELFVWPSPRLITVPGRRSRVPEICVTLEDPRIDVFEAPPLVCIEILSPRDEMSDVLQKLDEYISMGVPHVWLFDPRRKKAYAYSELTLHEIRSSAVEDPDHPINLPLEGVFRDLRT